MQPDVARDEGVVVGDRLGACAAERFCRTLVGSRIQNSAQESPILASLSHIWTRIRCLGGVLSHENFLRRRLLESLTMDEDFGVDLDQVRAFLADKKQRRRARVDMRFAQATRDAQTIISEIVTQVNPRRIYQWGSLRDRKRFSEISDVDIAVEGLNGPAEFFQVLGIAMNETALPVDVVELEKVPADVADRIRKRGVLVHERRNP